MRSIKEINIKIRTNDFFDDMVKIKDFNPDLLKIEKKSYKNIDVYYIGLITVKDFDNVKINNVNPLYLIIGKVDGYIKEKNGNKYLTLASKDKNKKVLQKYTELWDRTKNLIEKINDIPGDYEEKYMKIKFNSDDNLPLYKILKLDNITIVIRSVFQEDNKYYPKVFLDECLHEL